MCGIRVWRTIHRIFSFPARLIPEIDLKLKKHIIEMCLFFGTPIGNRSA